MRRVGKRTREWDRVRAELKVRFLAVGITYCEFGYAGCWRSNGLSFAHPAKRLELRPGELYIAALACPQCHDTLDNKMSHEKMREAVEKVIANRACQP